MGHLTEAVDIRGAFPLNGGRPCLNLVATLDKRHADPVERLPDVRALAEWLLDAGLPTRVAVPPPTASQLQATLELRESTNRLVRSTMAGQPLDADDVARLNLVAAGPDLAPQLRVGTVTRLEVRGSYWIADDLVDAALSSLARDVILLLTSQDVARIKECEHPDCSLLFLDDSQSGNRRWCSMDRCGNLAKVAGYRNRRARRRSGQ